MSIGNKKRQFNKQKIKTVEEKLQNKKIRSCYNKERQKWVTKQH